MNDFKEFVDEIEKDFLLQVVILLEQGKFSTIMAKTAAQEFLKLLPFTSFIDMKIKFHNFCLKNTSFLPLEIKIINYEEETKTKELLQRMQGFMKEKNIDEAVQLATDFNKE